MPRQRLSRDYREPTDAEAEVIIERMRVTLDGRSSNMCDLQAVGYQVTEGHFAGKSCTLFVPSPTAPSDQSWGVYVMDSARPIRYAVAAPHPGADIATDTLAEALWSKLNGSVLLLASAHRRAANSLADVAHQTGSLFHKVSDLLARRGVMQVQFHGYADSSAPDYDIILSSSVTKPQPSLLAVNRLLKAQGFRTATSWEDADKTKLFAFKNKQAIVANEVGSSFVHIEMGRTLRADPVRNLLVIDIIADVLR